MHAASRSPVVLRSLMLAVAGVLPLGLLAASAQAPPTPPQAETPPANLDTLKARDQELEALRAEQRRTLENEARLKREIESIGDAGRGIARDATANRGAGGRSRRARALAPANCRRARPPRQRSFRARGRAPTAVPVHRGAAKTIGGGGTGPHR